MSATLGSLLEGVDRSAAGGLTTEITGITYDSRQVKPGSVFVCIRGYRQDGHAFIDDAVRRGAAAVIIDKRVPLPSGLPWARVRNSRSALGRIAANFHGHPSRRLTMIGVTGTNGKTTTTNLIETLLRNMGQQTGLIGTIWNKVGDKKLPVLHTTPESSDLQALLAEMVKAGVETVSMEVSSHALVLDRVSDCEYDVAVFTNLTQDHLDFHKTMENYLAAKARLFTSLGRKRTKNRPCYGVINLDDPAGERIRQQTKVQVIGYGIRAEGADLKASEIELHPHGSSFRLNYQGRETHIEIPLPGEFNIYNSLAAMAVALQEGLELECLPEVMRGIEGVPGRFQPLHCGQDFTVIIDYAHTPDGLENVLKTARAITKGRLITVFGCGGDRDAGKRPIMGRIAGELSDLAIITSDNPRTEDPAKIARQVEEGIKGLPCNYLVVVDRKEAIREALQAACPGDLVLVAGKGHETYQIIGTEAIPFDDSEVVRHILEKEIIG